MKAVLNINMNSAAFSDEWDRELRETFSTLAEKVGGLVIGGDVSGITMPVRDSNGVHIGSMTIDFIDQEVA
jgi:hypothetical protein